MYRVLNSIFDYSNNWDKKKNGRKVILKTQAKKIVRF